MMMARLARALALVLAFSATPALAQADALAGTWAMEAEGHPVMLLTLAHGRDGWHAAARWLHWQGDVDRVSAVRGPATRDVLTASVSGDAATLVYPDRTTIGVRLLAPDVAEWRPRGDAGSAATGGDSGPTIVLRRVPAGTVLGAGVDPARAYAIDAPYPDNPAMTRLFDADQGDRRGEHIDWRLVAPADARRRTAAQALLDADALHSGTDFWHAAFIFQHGDAPADYLKAHALAVIAASRGRRDAAWIAAATLDRYLQRIGQQQVYGTQYRTAPGAPATQEPYDRTVLSDALRRATGVPTIAEQEVRRAGYDAMARR